MKKVIITLVVLVMAGLSVATYLWNKPHRNIASEEAAFTLDAVQLLDDFQTDYDSAWAKYRNQTISITGKVSDVHVESNAENYLSLDVEDRMGGVICYMDSTVTLKGISVNDLVQVKGKVNGYDPDLFQEVEVKECTLVKK